MQKIMNNNSNKTPQFFGMKSREFKDLYFLYLDLCVAKLKKEEILQSLSQSMITSFGFPESVSTKVAKILYEKFSDASFVSSFCDLQGITPKFSEQQASVSLKYDTPEESDDIWGQMLFMTTTDYERYKTMTSVDPNISPELKHLLLAFMSVYRRNFHKSGWVKYDRKAIMHLAGLQGISTKALEELTQYLHQEYGLEMQVVGSNSPIPCFKFQWMFEQQQPGSHINQFLDFGRLSPETIVQISSGAIEPKTID